MVSCSEPRDVVEVYRTIFVNVIALVSYRESASVHNVMHIIMGLSMSSLFIVYYT